MIEIGSFETRKRLYNVDFLSQPKSLQEEEEYFSFIFSVSK